MSITRRSTSRAALRGCLTIGMLSAAVLVSGADAASRPDTASPSASAAASARFTQPACAKHRTATRRARGAAKRAARARLQQCQADRRAYNQIKNSRFVGARTDYVEIDSVYCANGKWLDDGRKVADMGWRVTGTRPLRGARFTAIVEAKIPGGRHVQAIVKDATGWKVGYEFGGKAHNAGTVEKTSARALCATL